MGERLQVHKSTQGCNFWCCDLDNMFASFLHFPCYVSYEISLIQWIWMDSTETDVSALKSDTLGFLDAF
jgi:hypothetical protein